MKTLIEQLKEEKHTYMMQEHHPLELSIIEDCFDSAIMKATELLEKPKRDGIAMLFRAGKQQPKTVEEVSLVKLQDMYLRGEIDLDEYTKKAIKGATDNSELREAAEDVIQGYKDDVPEPFMMQRIEALEQTLKQD